MTVETNLRPPMDRRDAAAARSICYVCFTHVPMLIAYPPFVKTLQLGELQAPGQLSLRDLAPRWAPYHGMTGHLAGSFALRHYILAHQPDVRHVGLCQYRKFVTRRQVGQRGAGDQTVMDVVTRQGISGEVLAEAMLPEGDDYLLVRPSHLLVNGAVQSYLAQYMQAHHVQDFLRFIAMAVDFGVLDKAEVIPVFAETIFMIGGVELGVFPADFWLSTIGRLEEMTWAVVQTHLTRREGAGQARLWGYCMERLSSYLLLKQLRGLGGEIDPASRYFGHLTLVSDDGTYAPSV